MQPYEKRIAEIEFALYADYIFTEIVYRRKELLDKYFLITSTTYGFSTEDQTDITSLALNYKKLMPTEYELAAVSFYADQSINDFCKSPLIKKYIGRSTLFQIRREQKQKGKIIMNPIATDWADNLIIRYLGQLERITYTIKEGLTYKYGK